MVLGALLDIGRELGLRPQDIEQALAGLKLESWHLKVQEVIRGPIRACYCEVEVTRQPHAHRRIGDIKSLLAESSLPPEVIDSSLRTFEILARAEGKVHGVPPEEVTFHEVGAVDSIVDIVGSCFAWTKLGMPHVTCSRIALGGGQADTAHGRIPLPSPATCEILRGVPVRQLDTPFELTTPTGAALMVSLAENFGPAPDLVLECVGYGAGSDRPTPLPNVLRVLYGRRSSAHAEGLVVLETNLDNVSAELSASLVDFLFEQGALDVFFTPIVMKKSRPAHKLSVLCTEALRERIEQVIFEQIPTLGIRRIQVERTALERRRRKLQTPWGELHVKEALRRGRVIHAWPEYEDLREAARRAGLGIERMRAEIMRRYQETFPEDS